MSTPRSFLLCDSLEHATVVDQLVLARLESEFGVRANAWSEVYSDGERFGIYWAEPVSSLFGAPEDDPSLVIVEDTEGTWEVVRPEVEAASDALV